MSRALNGVACLLAATIALAIFAICPLAAAEPSGPAIVFGLDLDSTGPGAAFTTVSGRAVQEAIDYINEHGGILGRPIKTVTDNDESDATKAPIVTRKLIESGANIIFFITGPSSSIQAKPIVRDAKIVSFSPNTINVLVAGPPANEYMFSVGNASVDVTKLYCQVYTAIGLKKLAIFGESSALIDFSIRALGEPLRACVEIVAIERAPIDANDLVAEVTRIKNANPDGVLTISGGGRWEAFAHQTIKDVMPKVQHFSTSGLGNQPDAWELVRPGGLEGLVYTASVSAANPLTKEIESYIKSKRKNFTSLTAFDGWAWDNVMVVKTAIEMAGGVDDKQKLHDAVESIKGYKAHFGQPGFTLSFAPDKHIGSDGLCGMIMNVFGPDNKPSSTPWSGYQPKC